MPQSLFLLLPYLLANIVSAAYLQYPLQKGNSDAWNKLNGEVGNLISYAHPVARPCYEETFNEVECDIVKKWKNNDLWVSDHAGGYFYVCCLIREPWML